jgi:hypothetical protein
LALVLPLSAQQPPAQGPTVQSPVRFDAVAMSYGGNSLNNSAMVQIVIERWTTDAEREGLVEQLMGASFKQGGQDKLLRALQQVKPRAGFMMLPKTNGWDLKYARESTLEDGSRQIDIATDKPVKNLAAQTSAESMDYPFTFIEMRFPKGSSKGEGKLLASSAVVVKDGRLQLQNYGLEPVKLTSITERTSKKN